VHALLMQLLDAGIGLFEHGLGKCAGPLNYRHPPVLRGVPASQIRQNHAANQARINARLLPQMSTTVGSCVNATALGD